MIKAVLFLALYILPTAALGQQPPSPRPECAADFPDTKDIHLSFPVHNQIGRHPQITREMQTVIMASMRTLTISIRREIRAQIQSACRTIGDAKPANAQEVEKRAIAALAEGEKSPECRRAFDQLGAAAKGPAMARLLDVHALYQAEYQLSKIVQETRRDVLQNVLNLRALNSRVPNGALKLTEGNFRELAVEIESFFGPLKGNEGALLQPGRSIVHQKGSKFEDFQRHIRKVRLDRGKIMDHLTSVEELSINYECASILQAPTLTVKPRPAVRPKK